jgi:hypothetical protein
MDLHDLSLYEHITKCAADITSNGYDIEELSLPKATCYLVSCKQCKTILGIVQEK